MKPEEPARSARSARKRQPGDADTHPTHEATADPALSCGARQPQQVRGQRRFDAILDATAELIAEEGIGGVRMHRICQRTQTTTGSMYHFFPDRDALLRALVSRQTRELRAEMERLECETAEWAQLPTAEAIDRFLSPFLTYVEAHPAFLPLARLVRMQDSAVDRDADLDRLVLRLAEAVVASRDASVAPEDLRARAMGVIAIAEGMVDVCARAPVAEDATMLRRELRRALVAYLDSYRLESSAG